jgi:nucleotide-binding universal stress UspA family protein
VRPELVELMKSILVPVEPHHQMASVLDHALLLARIQGSYIEGFALRHNLPISAVDPMVAAFVLSEEMDDKTSSEHQARQLFETFMVERSVARSEGQSAGPTYGWLDDAPAGESFLGSYSRVFDITVVGRSGDHVARWMTTLEAALFESGRPVLLAPARAPERLASAIVIAWNGSTETARAITLSMHLLKQARQVVVLTAEGGSVPGGPSGEQVVRSLKRHGIGARALDVRPGRSSVGETILSEASAVGCDLLIKGAYTQSRLREMIFGGPTNHILFKATLPVLLAH